MKIFTENCIISDKQFGFKPKSSCLDANMLIYNDIINALNGKHKFGILQLDLSKAFDLVNHKILLTKLFSIGLDIDFIRFFESYLNNRYGFVKSIGKYSELFPIELGVFQGSILGPLLFLLYINDITKLELNATLYLYADDTSLLYKCSDFDKMEENINQDYDKILKWLSRNQLIINNDKSKFISFGSYPKKDILVRGNSIKHVDSLKILGLIFDSNLNFKTTFRVYIPKFLKKSVFYLD